jgi:RimJ/RimL family protein N-acetyltransferase
MADADIAVAAAGSTCWELCRMGLPAVLVSMADNQRPVAQHLAAGGAAVDAGWWRDLSAKQVSDYVLALALDPGKLRSMSAQASALVDGRGAHRVITAMRARDLGLRPVAADDASRLFDWANDRTVRDASFHPDPIEWSEHVRWFEQRLRSPICYWYLALDRDGQPLGQIRFDLDDLGQTAEVGVSVAPPYRGAGLGGVLIRAASDRLLRETAVTVINAVVKATNVASASSFDAAGYERLATRAMVGHEQVQRYALHRDGRSG